MGETHSIERYRLSSRLECLRERMAVRASNPPALRKAENTRKAFFELYADRPLPERQARSLAYALVNEPVRVDDADHIVGQFYGGWSPRHNAADSDWRDFCEVTSTQRRTAAEIPEMASLSGRDLAREDRTFLVSDEGIPGHVAWNYQWVLRYGLDSMIEAHRAAAGAAADGVSRAYYRGVVICLEAVLEWNRRHVAELRRLLGETDAPDSRGRLKECIAIMGRVPAHPARTFHEAMQSFYFIWTVVMYENPWGGNSPGRMDYFLWPYLRDELESGALSLQDAGDLVAETFLKIDERVHFSDGHVNTIVVGGIGPDGKDTTNPLTYIMLDAIEQLDITHPAVYTRIAGTSPDEYVDRCAEYLLGGGNRAQILIDEPIIGALTSAGDMPFEDAALYTCGGCMEINPHGMNSDLLFSFIYNVPKALELVLSGGEDLKTGKRRLEPDRTLCDYAGFEELYAAFEAQMRRHLTAKFRNLDIWSEEMARMRPTYLLSALTTGCFEAGRDQQDGGARYGTYGGTPLGIQNAADALTAVKLAIYDEAFATGEELLEALRADFQGHQALRARLLSLPKYGVGHGDADAMMNRVLGSICDIFGGYRNRHGRAVRPIIFTFVWAPSIGRDLGASPDGRLAGRPIGHGLTPQAVGMREGLTAAMGSYLSLDTSKVTGGASTMWDMDADWISFPVLRGLVEAFRRKGGMIFQGNMTSVDELVRAFESPEDYPNLIVRVGGFSARFVSLNRAVQKEIIERHRHTG